MNKIWWPVTKRGLGAPRGSNAGMNKTWVKILSKYFQGHNLVNHIDVKWIGNKTGIQLYYGKAVIIIDIVTMLLFSTFYHCYKHITLNSVLGT